MNRRASPFIPLFLSLHKRCLWQTMSNAFEKCGETPGTFREGLASEVR